MPCKQLSQFTEGTRAGNRFCGFIVKHFSNCLVDFEMIKYIFKGIGDGLINQPLQCRLL